MNTAPHTPPRIGIVSLGCAKALVDSERILTRLRAEGYVLSPSYEGADLVLVNTCGFLDSAKRESLDAIGEALTENGKVVVTGCLGVDEQAIREVHPGVLQVTGPHQYEAVVEAVHSVLPPAHDPHRDLVPPGGLKLTPRHYAYLKISEGCDHACDFCIIPDIRGRLTSRPAAEVLEEAERLAGAGVKELLVVSQDTGAYGRDLGHAESPWHGAPVAARMTDLARALGDLGIWVRLHYVYPYPQVDHVVPLMAEGRVLPYLDVPLQHASPPILRAMKRPANEERMLDRIRHWRRVCPDITIRSTFIVGYPGETEEDFEYLLDWLEEAQLDRVGCFPFEPVAGAAASTRPDQVDDDVKQERWERLMDLQHGISEARQRTRIGRVLPVIVDAVDADGAEARTRGDSPEVDGVVHIADAAGLAPGDIVEVRVTGADAYDLEAVKAGD